MARYKELICAGAAWAVTHPVPYPTRRRRTTPAAVPTVTLSR